MLDVDIFRAAAQFACDVTSLTPTYTNRAPTVRFSHNARRLDALKRPATRAADQATNRFQRVPLKMNTMPRNRKASGLLGAPGSTNCGRNARKKSATFGLRTLVRKPCRNTVRSPAACSSGVGDRFGVRAKKSDAPT